MDGYYKGAFCLRKIYVSNWSEPERSPHLSYFCTKSSRYIYIYICVCTIRLSVHRPIWPHKGPLNAQRANVGPTSKGSKVNNITLKTATVVLRFFQRLSFPTEQLVQLYISSQRVDQYHENSGRWTDRVAHYALYFCIDRCRFYFSSCTCVAACLVRYYSNVVLLILPIYTCRLYIFYGGHLRMQNGMHMTKCAKTACT